MAITADEDSLKTRIWCGRAPIDVEEPPGRVGDCLDHYLRNRAAGIHDCPQVLWFEASKNLKPVGLIVEHISSIEPRAT